MVRLTQRHSLYGGKYGRGIRAGRWGTAGPRQPISLHNYYLPVLASGFSRNRPTTCGVLPVFRRSIGSSQETLTVRPHQRRPGKTRRHHHHVMPRVSPLKKWVGALLGLRGNGPNARSVRDIKFMPAKKPLAAATGLDCFLWSEGGSENLLLVSYLLLLESSLFKMHNCTG